MYENFYRLSGIPFQLTPDTRFFFGSSSHSRAISHLVYGLEQQEGFIVITGEVGAGKTTLVEQLWSQLDRRTYVLGRVVTTQVSGDDLLRLIVTSYGIEDGGADKATLLRRFEKMVREQRAQGRRCLLVVDEVQNLTVVALEELRMLSNITLDSRASVQTILLGQPQFRPMLASQELEQLRQRVLASYHLGPLTEPETRSYVEHRLRTVGWTDDPHWQELAFSGVFHHSGGIPRRVNTLCTRILLYGALEESHEISAEMVETIATELDRDIGSGGILPPPPGEGQLLNGAGSEGLSRRIAALEHGVARQDRIFRRLIDLLGGYQAGHR